MRGAGDESYIQIPYYKISGKRYRVATIVRSIGVTMSHLAPSTPHYSYL